MCTVRKNVLRNFGKFTGKHLYHSFHSFFFNKVAGLLKKRLRHWCFPANFAKFLRTHFLQNTFRRLLLYKNLSQIINQSDPNLFRWFYNSQRSSCQEPKIFIVLSVMITLSVSINYVLFKIYKQKTVCDIFDTLFLERQIFKVLTS